MTIKGFGVIALAIALVGCSAEEPVEQSALDERPVEQVSAKAEPEAQTIKVDASSTTFTQAESFRIISEAGHHCPAVVRVEAKSDSTIATCDDGETYRVLRLTEPKVMEVAMKCSAMAGMGIEGGC